MERVAKFLKEAETYVSFYKSIVDQDRASVVICNLKDIHTGKVDEVMLIKSPADLEHFKAMYGIDGEIAKEY